MRQAEDLSHRGARRLHIFLHDILNEVRRVQSCRRFTQKDQWLLASFNCSLVQGIIDCDHMETAISSVHHPAEETSGTGGALLTISNDLLPSHNDGVFLLRTHP